MYSTKFFLGAIISLVQCLFSTHDKNLVLYGPHKEHNILSIFEANGAWGLFRGGGEKDLERGFRDLAVVLCNCGGKPAAMGLRRYQMMTGEKCSTCMRDPSEV